MNILSAKNLFFRYNTNQAWILKDFFLEVKAGEIIQIKGNSGCGKTTLLYNLCGVIPKTIHGIQKGIINIFGKPILSFSLPELSLKISILLQNPEHQLFFPSVEQELAFYPENLRIEPKVIEHRLSKILKELEIEQLRNRETAFLSYGEKKLVALASLLTFSPQVLLLDELFNGISDKKIELLITLIQKLSQQGKAIIATEHLNFFSKIATKTIEL
ncbi:MAG: ABC transporter ATP-binding protein [Candidatus Cloacimonadota bacterium]|nr:ABC transporter ATP-binding protein [Candidatus Cloacimonadota bacterium]